MRKVIVPVAAYCIAFMALGVLLSSRSLAQRLANPHLARGSSGVAGASASMDAGPVFVRNLGQLADQFGRQMPEVLYTCGHQRTQVYLTANSVHYVFRRTYGSGLADAIDSTVLYRLDAQFLGANRASEVIASDKIGTYCNYYLAQCPDGIVFVPSYRQLLYKDLYPGIDMVVVATEEGMRYDFIVHPGSDPSQIRMRYDGQTSLLVRNGELHIATPLGSVDENELNSFVQYEGKNTPVRSRFIVDGDVVRFKVGRYDRTKTLVIDPTRLWATYFGGGGYDNFLMVTTGSDNTITAAGQTSSTTGIATSGAHQVTTNGGGDDMIAHFDAAGSLLWATYYGGSGSENPEGLATDSGRNIIFYGATSSTTAIATSGSYQSAYGGNTDNFIVKFNSSGVRQWATYFGGSGNEGLSNSWHKLALDSQQNIIIGGGTSSTSGIATSGAYQTTYGGGTADAFVAKFTSAGNLRWATYLGGSANDGASCIATDKSGNIVLGGITYSTSGIATSGAFLTSAQGGADAFISKFDSTGSLLWSTYYGGSSDDIPYDAITDTANAIMIAGSTLSGSGIATSGAYQTTRNATSNGFIAKFTPSGSEAWGTYFGSIGLSGISRSSTNEIYVAGYAGSSSANIVTTDAYQSVYGGGTHDLVAAKFSQDGAFLWGSYYGDAGDDDGDAIAVDAAGNMIVSGATSSTSNIATSGAYQTNYGGSPFDALLVKFCEVLTPRLRATYDTICSGTLDSIFLSIGSASIRWHDGASALSQLNDLTRFIRCDTLSAGLHAISATLTNGSGCDGTSDTLFLLIHPSPVVDAGRDTVVCGGTPVTLSPNVTGGTTPLSYYWTPATGLSDRTIRNPLANPSVTTRYTLIVTDSNGCQALDSVTVSVYPKPQLAIMHSFTICMGDTITVGDTATGGSPPYAYSWIPGSGISSMIVAKPKVYPQTTTTYYETVTDAHGCATYDSVVVLVNPVPHPSIVPSGAVTQCGTDSVVLHAAPGYVSYVWNTGSIGDSLIVRTPGSYAVTVVDLNGCHGTSDTVYITTHPKPSAVISGPNTACPNSTVGYSVPLSSGGQYQWTLAGGGTITSGSISNAISVNWTSAGSWKLSVKVISAFGCESDTTITVNVNSTLTPSVSPPGPLTLCNGDTVILRASKGFVTYTWSDGSHADSIVVTKSGDYTVTVTATGGCQGSSTAVKVTVLPTPKPQPVIAASMNSLCDGDTSVLFTTQTFTTYRWSTGEQTPTIRVARAGTYTVTVTNSDGCDGTSRPVVITVNPRPVVNITMSGPTTFCDGDSVTLSAGGTAASYRWSSGDTARSIVVRKSGVYSVTATSDSGCTTTSAPVTVTINAMPSPTIAGPQSVCPNATTTYSVNVVVGDTYSWSLNPPGSGTIATPNTATTTIQWGAATTATLSITETTSDGCSATKQMTVIVSSTLVPVITANGSLVLCDGDSITLDAGAGYRSYQWSRNGAMLTTGTGRTIRVGASGSYTVFVVSGAGCSGSSLPVNVIVHPLPAPTIVLNGSTLTTQSFASYQWNIGSAPIAGANNQSFTPSAQGTYTVTVTDSNGCAATSGPFGFGLNATATVRIQPVTSAAPGQDVDVPVLIENANNLIESGAKHYVGVIRFNSSLLISRTPTPLGSVSGADRLITIMGDNTVASGTLQTLHFTAALGTDSCTDISIDTFYWTDADVTVTREGGEFCLSGICISDGHPRLVDPNGHVSISQARPNPAERIVHLEFETSETGRTQLFISDLLGKHLLSVIDGELKPGMHSVDVDVSSLSSGSYLYSLQTPTLVLTKIMQITH